MFPPEETEDPHHWLNNLWFSLQRAGGHLSQNARIFEKEDGACEVILYLQERLPNNITRTLSEYIKGYSKASGWTVKSCQIDKGQIVLRACPSSSAPSSRSKKA